MILCACPPCKGSFAETVSSDIYGTLPRSCRRRYLEQVATVSYFTTNKNFLFSFSYIARVSALLYWTKRRNITAYCKEINVYFHFFFVLLLIATYPLYIQHFRSFPHRSLCYATASGGQRASSVALHNVTDNTSWYPLKTKNRPTNKH